MSTSIEFQKLERIERQVGDLRGLLVSVERGLRRSRKTGDPAEQFFKAAVAAARKERFEYRAITNPARTDTPGWAQELLASPVGGLLLSLTQSAFTTVARHAVVVGFDPFGQVRMIYDDVVASASWVGEAQPVPVTAATLASLIVKAAKVRSVIVYSEELRESSDFEAVARRLLSDAIATTLDATFFSPVAASATTPGGALVGVTPIVPSDATPPSEAARQDVRSLVRALGSPGDVVLCGSAATVAYLSSVLGNFAYELAASASIADDILVAIDASGIVMALAGVPSFKAAKEAALVLQDEAGIGPAVATAPTMSLWQQNSEALSVGLGVSWGIRPGSVAYVEGITW